MRLVRIFLLLFLTLVSTSTAAPIDDAEPNTIHLPIVQKEHIPCPPEDAISDKIAISPSPAYPSWLLDVSCLPDDTYYMTWHSHLHPSWPGRQVPMVWGLLVRNYNTPTITNLLEKARSDLGPFYNGDLIIFNEPDLYGSFNAGGQAAESPLNTAETIMYAKSPTNGVWQEANIIGPGLSEAAWNGQYMGEVYYQLRVMGGAASWIEANSLHLYYRTAPSVPGYRDGVNGDEPWPDDRILGYMNGIESYLISHGFNSAEAYAISRKQIDITETAFPWNALERLGYPYTDEELYDIGRERLRQMEENPFVRRYHLFARDCWHGQYGSPGFEVWASCDKEELTTWGKTIVDHVRWTAGYPPIYFNG